MACSYAYSILYTAVVINAVDSGDIRTSYGYIIIRPEPIMPAAFWDL